MILPKYLESRQDVWLKEENAQTEYGFKNIELSGGTEYYDGFENDLLKLKYIVFNQ